MKITSKIYLVFSLFVVSLIRVQAQEILSREDSLAIIRARDFPNIEVGKGISFMPADSLYRLNLRFRMQNLAAFSLDENNELTSELRVKRLRLRFEGFAFSPKLNYVIQLARGSQYNQ
jgi:phosphate-selective porin OprO and OprP